MSSLDKKLKLEYNKDKLVKVKKMRSTDVFDSLCEKAFFVGGSILSSGHSHARQIEQCIMRGQSIPDHLLPGRLIMNLDQNLRQKLSTLQSSDTEKYFIPNTVYYTSHPYD